MVKLAQMYQAVFRTKLFNRIILVYSTLTIFSFCTLAILIYEYSASSMRQKELNGQAETVDSMTRYLDGQMDSSREIVLQLYQNQALLSDLLFFLRHDMERYVQYRFNQYISSNTSEDRSLETFIRTHMDRNGDIAQIALYSREQSFLYLFNGNKTQKLSLLQEEQQEVAHAVEAMRYQGASSAKALGISNILELKDEGVYTYTFELNDPLTLENAGTLLISYSPVGLSRITGISRNGEIGTYLVLFQDGRVVYDSTNQINSQFHPFRQELLSVNGMAKLHFGAYVTTMRTAKSKLLVAGMTPESELENLYAGFRNKVIAITGIGIIITILFSYFSVYRYAKRTRTIVKAMKQAQQGNLAVRIPTGHHDELDEISDRFNRMCEELLGYINQVYVSEIKQKHAELVAFQAQINPHFLYNTLEAIRMRALTQGATDVGEMAYVLGALFRYAVKPETMVSIEEEADYCRQFLELYRIRYRDHLAYSIEVDEAVSSSKVFKLSMQPLVENAIVHGVKPSKQGSKITIRAYPDDQDSIRIEVEDNGKGIKEEPLLRIQNMLNGRLGPGEASSLGLRSVHERIRLTYGESYGLDIRSRWSKGTIVTIRVPRGKELN